VSLTSYLTAWMVSGILTCTWSWWTDSPVGFGIGFGCFTTAGLFLIVRRFAK
jgi:hypothetical protein